MTYTSVSSSGGRSAEHTETTPDTRTWSHPMTDLFKVTRVEVIDANGRSYTSYNADQVHISVQDNGKTLKIFHTGDTSHSMRNDHAQSLGALMTDDLEQWRELSQQIAEETFHAQAEAVTRDD